MSDTEVIDSDHDESKDESILEDDRKIGIKSKILSDSDKLQYNKKFKAPLRKKRKNQYNPVEEARLERIVFGDTSDIINNLVDNEESVRKSNKVKSPSILSNVSWIKSEDTDDDKAGTTVNYSDTTEAADVDSGAETENLQKGKRRIKKKLSRTDKDDAEYTVDAEQTESEEGPSLDIRSRDIDIEIEAEDLQKEEENKEIKRNEEKPAWTDEDDAEYTVDTALSIQGRKLPMGRPEKMYTELLQNKYKQLVGTPEWADINKKKEIGSDDSDDEILKHSCHLVTQKVKNLAKGTIKIKVLNSINKKTQSEGPLITSLEFHPTSTVALVAGVSGILSIFAIDGRENEKLYSVQFKNFPIDTAKFIRGGDEIVLGSKRHAHCHAYDLISGKFCNIPLPHGITNMKKLEVSPDGKLLAFCGRRGEIHLLANRSKELVGTLKINERCNTLAFTPDGKKLFTHGDGGEMYIWDVNSRTCMHRAFDDGCLSGTTIAVSPSGQFLATGSKQGVVNIYNVDTALQQRNPMPVKTILNLVTPITSLCFNPSSEILAMASREKENAFRMVHLPSATVFSNFPTFQSKIFNPWSLAFSPSSGYLGIGNNKSNAFLCRLKHYGNY